MNALLWIIGHLIGLIAANDSTCFDCIFKVQSSKASESFVQNDKLNFTPAWLQLGKPDNDIDLCLNSIECRQSVVKQYLIDNGHDCNGDGSIGCIDYALIFLSNDSNCQTAPSIVVESLSQQVNSCLDQDKNVISNLDEVTSQSSYTLTGDNLEPSTEGYETLRTTIPPVAANLINKECLKCICEASTNCDSNTSCTNEACGPFRLSRNYYESAGSPGDGFEVCCRDVACSEKVIQSYVLKHLKDCDSNSLIDCDDFAAIHRYGNSCANYKHKQTEYWRHFEYCTVMADSVRREVDPWENSPRPSVNQPSMSLPPLVPYPVRLGFSTKPPINTINHLTSQMINLDEHCLNCICQASSGCNITRTQCPNGSNCGPYQIDLSYIKEAGGDSMADNTFEDCANDKECSENIVRVYMKRNVMDCNEDEILDCTDFALVHKLGRSHCRQAREVESFLNSAYWAEFQACYGFD
uniref:lysozyme n=2 Tax=Tetranychus urticae TaxID=32264 RepID=T1KQ17_TETUR